MLKHGLLDGLFLLNGLLFQAKELFLGILLHGQGILVACPNLMTLLDAVLTVLAVMFVVGLQGLNHITNNILCRILHHPSKHIDARTHARDGYRKRRKFQLTGLATLSNVICGAHYMEHVLLKLIRILVQTLSEILYKLVVANCKVL